MQILSISVAHIAGALRRRHAAVLARNQIACFRHYVTEHPTRIGGVHCVAQPRAIARFRHARVKQWNVVARREPPIGNGAVAAKIDTDNLPNSLWGLFDSTKVSHAERPGFTDLLPHHLYSF